MAKIQQKVLLGEYPRSWMWSRSSYRILMLVSKLFPLGCYQLPC